MKLSEKLIATVLAVFLIFTEIGAPIALAILLAVWVPTVWKLL